MQFFRIYRHKTKGYYAAPIGFNMQAAMFLFLWAAANNLWSKAVLLFVFLLSMAVIILYGMNANMEVLTYAGIAGLSILPIWAGTSGNAWIFANLESQNFRLVRKIRATSANNAIMQARKSENNPKRSGDKKMQASDKNTSEEDLPIHAEPEWRRRRSNRMIK